MVYPTVTDRTRLLSEDTKDTIPLHVGWERVEPGQCHGEDRNHTDQGALSRVSHHVPLVFSSVWSSFACLVYPPFYLSV